MQVRRYKSGDYEQLKALYLDSSTFGGQYDEARDSSERLQKKVEADPDAILVAEENGRIIGTVSLIDDGRVAWLFRFAVAAPNDEAARALHDKAVEILKSRGHQEVLVYSPMDNSHLGDRYERLGFTKGNDYTCYWKSL